MKVNRTENRKSYYIKEAEVSVRNLYGLAMSMKQAQVPGPQGFMGRICQRWWLNRCSTHYPSNDLFERGQQYSYSSHALPRHGCLSKAMVDRGMSSVTIQ